MNNKEMENKIKVLEEENKELKKRIESLETIAGIEFYKISPSLQDNDAGVLRTTEGYWIPPYDAWGGILPEPMIYICKQTENVTVTSSEAKK